MKFLRYLGFLALFVAIFAVQTVWACQISSVNFENTVSSMTSAAPDDVGAVVIFSNNTWSNTSAMMQSSSATKQIGQLDSALEFNSAIKFDQRRFDSVSINVFDGTRASLKNLDAKAVRAISDYMMTNSTASGDRTPAWAMVQIKDSAANPRTTLKCPFSAEKSYGMDLMITAARTVWRNKSSTQIRNLCVA